MTARRVWVNTAITREAYYRRDETQAAPKPPTRGTPADTLREFIVRPEWFADAACRGMGPDMFFPEKGQAGRETTIEARRICASCPTRRECEAEMLSLPPGQRSLGTWAGISAAERKRKRYVPATVPCGWCGKPFVQGKKRVYCGAACSHAADLKMRSEARKKQREPIAGAAHGTRAGYVGSGCRCDECRAYKADTYQRWQDGVAS